MRVYRTADYAAMSRKAADIIASLVILDPACVLGLATGSSPIGTYQRLAERCRAGELDFSNVQSVNLDEYRGLPVTHDQSYRYFMDHNLFDHINIRKEHTHVPNGMAGDIEAECRRYDELVEGLGGAHLQLLGLGHDGHIGFNEPCGHFPKGTHLVDLDPMTLEANARFFGGDPGKVPTQAVTMGIGTILSAGRILVIVSGADKASIVARAFLGPVTPQVPASILQLHRDVTLVADEAALEEYLKEGGRVCS